MAVSSESILVVQTPRSERRLVGFLAPLMEGRRFLRREPFGGIGALLFLAMIAIAILAPVIAPHNPLEIRGALTYQATGSGAVFGTDKYGRDILSRVIYGARISVYVGALTVLLGTTFGLLVGLFRAYVGGPSTQQSSGSSRAFRRFRP